MKPKVHVIAPRYSFGPEHNATVKIHHDGRSIVVKPFDVSKGHLCVLVENANDYSVGMQFLNTHVFVQEKHFNLKKMVLEKILPLDGGIETKMVLRSDEDDDTSTTLWEVSYLLRTRPSEQSQIAFDDRSLPKVPGRGLYTEEARQDRLAFAREQTGAKLEYVSKTVFDPKALVSNIEAFIGSVEIPVGLAGPLYIKGEHANGLFYAPMATSEGALVASVTRGATAITRSGGVTTRVIGQRMLRVPMFVLSDMGSAMFFAEWVNDHFKEIAAQTRKYSNYANLTEIQTQLFGKTVYVHFVYQTGDAAGQNMTTTCTWQACQWIMNEMKKFEGLVFENFYIESNLSNDKKVTYQSFIKGRGIRVVCECVIPRNICETVLKVNPDSLFATYNKILTGCISAGMIGANGNIANVIGAMFTAAGQDIACVHESAIGQLFVEKIDDGDLYFAMVLPSLVVGTVGGGTGLPHQRECLELMGCAGPGNAHKLAEIIGSYCLALDLSTMSAIASDQFARAHEKLGRNRPVNWLKMGDFDKAFFDRAFRSYFNNPATTVAKAEQVKVQNMGSSIITELTSHKINKLVGHYPFRVQLEGQDKPVDVMLKIKPLDAEVILVSNSIAAMCDARLAQSYNQFKDKLEFKGCHSRELFVMSQQDERFRKHAPITYFTLQDPSREAYVLVQEFMSGLELMDTADDVSGWTEAHIFAAIDGMAELHSIWYEKGEELKQQNWPIYPPTRESVMEKIRLWEMLGAHAKQEFPEWFSDEDMENYREQVYTVVDWYGKLDSLPHTLIHNDFNPRNVAFRRNGDDLNLIAYDWELATWQVPQHDLAELLSFVLPCTANVNDVDRYVERHRVALERATGKSIDKEQWHLGYALSLKDLMINRIPMYVMGHTFRHYKFMERVLKSFRNLLIIERNRSL